MDLDFDIAIDRPPATVLDYVADIARWPAWRGALRSAERLPDDSDDPAQGPSRWRLKLHVMGRDVDMLVEAPFVDVTADRFDVVTAGGPIQGTNSFSVTPEGDGSRLRVTGLAELEGPLKFAEPLLAPQLRQAWLADLESLKRLLEAD